MNSDIRLSITFRRHRKRRKLNKILGPGATDYLIDLWIAAAVSRPDGVLTGWDPQDIAEEVDFQGDPQKLIDALAKSGWADINSDGTIILHDWLDYQGWASASNTRSTRARLNAMIRHHGREQAFKLAKEKLGINPADFGYVLLQQKIADATADAVAVLQQNAADAIAVPQQGIASTIASAPPPSPAPKPKPSLKDSTKVLSGDAGRYKKVHFTKKAPEYRDEIKNVCKKIEVLSNGSKRFNAYQWAQTWINKNGHPQAIIDSLEGLLQFWDELRGEPWPYADKIMRSKNGNYNELDETNRSEGYKKMLTELAKLIGPS